MKTLKRLTFTAIAFSALILAGCVGHTHTERVIERDVPTSTTTVVR